MRKQKVIDLKRVQEIRKRLNENIAGITEAYPDIEDDKRRVKAYQITAGEFPKSLTGALIEIAKADDPNLLSEIETGLGVSEAQDENQ
ncbi:MAG: hypothetical protein J6J23_06870 [Clostridia bacterium]|nr:hypothetical protein [Clostridia bacterium]